MPSSPYGKRAGIPVSWGGHSICHRESCFSASTEGREKATVVQGRAPWGVLKTGPAFQAGDDGSRPLLRGVLRPVLAISLRSRCKDCGREGPVILRMEVHTSPDPPYELSMGSEL